MKASLRAGALILLLCILCVYTPVTAYGARQTVRVGCVDIDDFLTIGEDGNAGGYGAEFLQRIARHTGWQYEYVQGTWEQCTQWLKEGEIDLLLPAEYSEERAEEYLFSDVPCCLDYAALVGSKNDSFCFEDYEAFDGMTVGMINGNYLNALFESYAVNNRFAFRPQYYSTGTALSQALESGEVDAIVNGNMEHGSNQKLLAKIDYMPAYFITSINNPALMKDLNNALHEIFLYNPYYTADLHSKYYESVERRFIGFTKQESEYISGKGEIAVLLRPDDYPMSWYDAKTKACKGVYVNMMKLIESESGLRFRFVAGGTEGGMSEQLRGGNADVWGSAYTGDGGQPMNGLVYTSSYYDCSYSFVGKKENSLNLSDALTIGIGKNELGLEGIIKKQYPHWKIIIYDSVKDCLEGVSQSKADLAAVSAWCLSTDETLLGSNLMVFDSTALSLPVYMGIPQENAAMLLSVLDKAILKIDYNDFRECAFNSILSVKSETSVADWMHKHPVYAVGAAMILLIAVMLGGFIAYSNRAQKKQNRILQMKNKELEEAIALQEHLREAAQTDALTGLKNKGTVERDCQDYLNNHAGKKHAILVMDIDNFKQINDTYGHLHGDRMLKQFGDILLESSEGEDIVGRIGGDEFLMFITRVEEKGQIHERVKRLYDNLAEKTKEPQQTAISCSIGIVLVESPSEQFSKLFLKADRALYKAKNDGKNRYVFAD